MRHWFGVYYIPPANDELYRLGSQLLGYDIRADAPLVRSERLRRAVGPIDEAWVAVARPFGFHLTLGEALTFEPGDLPGIADEVEAIVGAFSPESRFALEERGVVRWRDGEVWVLRCRASRALDILQAVLVARLSTLSEHSMFFDEIREHPDRYPEPYLRQRIATFLSPRGIDTWQPHFTLFNPYDGPPDPERVEALEALFRRDGPLVVRSLCLTVREGDGPWRIHREVALPGDSG